jgi:hypothetical protein
MTCRPTEGVSRDQQDNNNFFDTGIIFRPRRGDDVRGAEARLVVPSGTVRRHLVGHHQPRDPTPPFGGSVFGQDVADLLSAGLSPSITINA